MFRALPAVSVFHCGALLALLALVGWRPAGLPPPQPALTGFTPVLTMSPAALQYGLTGGTSTVAGTSLRVPLGSNQSAWPTVDLGRAVRDAWQRLAPQQEVLLEVQTRGLRPGIDAGVSLVWYEISSARSRRLRLDTGRSVRWKLTSQHPDQEGTAWLPNDPTTAAGPPLHRLGWLLRRDTVWAVIDNRPVAAYPQPFGLTADATTGHLTLELDGGSGQTVELTRVRVLAGPAHSAATLASHQQGRQQPAAAQAVRQQAEAALAAPAARPTDLTTLAELRGESLFGALGKLDGAAAYIAQEGEQVVLKGNYNWEFGTAARLPEAMGQAYRDRLGQQPLYLECRGQLLGRDDGPPKGQLALELAAAKSADDLSLAWSAGQAQWQLKATAAERTGPVAPAAVAQPHTLGLLLAGDSATAYFDDHRLPGRVFMGTLPARPNPNMPLNLRVWLKPGQTLRVDYIRLSGQGEAQAVAARQAATLARETAAREQAAREAAARETAAREEATRAATARATQPAAPSPTRTTASGVQYSTADMSMFTNTPAAQKRASRASRANEPRVTWLYARTYETMLTFSDNTAYQIVYAYVTAPASATQDEVLAAIPENAIRAGVGMRPIASTINKCDRDNCAEALSHYSGSYRNVSTNSAGQFQVN